MASSTSELIGDVAKAAVEALALSGVTAVVKRKLPGVPEGDDNGLPQVVISVGEEGKTEYLTATEKLKTYPVTIAIVTAGGSLAGDDPAVREWRQLIEEALDARATWVDDVAGWNRVSLTNRPPFDRASLSKDYNYSLVVAAVEVIEAHA